MAIRETLAAHRDVDVTVATERELIADTFTQWLTGGASGACGTAAATWSPSESSATSNRLTSERAVEGKRVRGDRGHALNERAYAFPCAAFAPPAEVERDQEFVYRSCYLGKERTQLVQMTLEACADRA